MHTRGSYLSELVEEITSNRVLYINAGNSEKDKTLNSGAIDNIIPIDPPIIILSSQYCDYSSSPPNFDRYRSRMNGLVEQVILEIVSYSSNDIIISVLTRINHIFCRIEENEKMVSAYYFNDKKLKELDEEIDREDFFQCVKFEHDSNFSAATNYYPKYKAKITGGFLLSVLSKFWIDLAIIDSLMTSLIKVIGGDNYLYKKELLDRFGIPYSGVISITEKISRDKLIDQYENKGPIHLKEEMTFRQISLFYYYRSLDNNLFQINKNNCIEIASKYGHDSKFSGKKLLQAFNEVIMRTGRVSICPNMSSYNTRDSNFKIVLKKLKGEVSEQYFQFAYNEYKSFQSINGDFSLK